MGVPDEARARLLVVDDEEIIRDLLELAFEGSGWAVTSVGSAEQAMAAIEDAPYDIYIVDKNLPESSGVELIQWVRKEDPIAGIMMVTGYASISSALDTLHEGIDAYIEKPFDVDAIVAAAFTALGRSHQRRDSAGASDSHLTIVVASNDGESLDWLRARLAGKNDVVEAVTLSERVMESVTKVDPDLVVLDAGLRSPPADDLIEQIGESQPKASLAIVNGNPSLEDVVTYISLGIRVVLKLPLSDADFEQKLGVLLAELRTG